MKKTVEKPIPTIQKEIEEVENLIEEQLLINQKIKKKRQILIAVMFSIVIVAVISSKIYNSSVYDKKIEEYRTYTESRIEGYEQFLESINE